MSARGSQPYEPVSAAHDDRPSNSGAATSRRVGEDVIAEGDSLGAAEVEEEEEEEEEEDEEALAAQQEEEEVYGERMDKPGWSGSRRCLNGMLLMNLPWSVEYRRATVPSSSDATATPPSESESGSESGSDSLTWISWFCSLPGHEYFAEVAEDFIEDDFNLTGLTALVPFYKEALEMILDVDPPEEEALKIPDVSIVESSAELLYGLIHQRYILTRPGLQQMLEKFESGHFGYCPRVFCHSHPVLPCGRSDLPGLDTVKLYCANCVDIYSPPSSRFQGVDGAFFGTTFPHLLFQTYRDFAPSPLAPRPSTPPTSSTNTPWSFTTVDPNPSGFSPGPAATLGGDPSRTGSPLAKKEMAEDADPSSQVSGTAEGGGGGGGEAIVRTLQPHQLGQKEASTRIYTARIYGFRVSELSRSGPRMRWLRARPQSLEELERGERALVTGVAGGGGGAGRGSDNGRGGRPSAIAAA